MKSSSAARYGTGRRHAVSGTIPTYPHTYPLQLVYKDALLDLHLHAAMQNRTMRITQKQFTMQNSKGEEDEALSTLLQQEWFTQLVGYALEAIFYGYSLVQMRVIAGVPQLRNLPRTHIIPQTERLVQDYNADEKWLTFTNHPHQLLFAQRDCDSKGLLEKVAPLTMLKRHSIGSWGEYTQLFGVPLRIAKVPNVAGSATADIERWFEQMGSAVYAIFPTGSEIEIKESWQTDAHKVFEQLIKLINGQTMTMDDGASPSQSQVHAQTENHLTKADLRWVLGWCNRTQAVEKGYGKTLVSMPFGEQAYTLLAELKYNAGVFVALKNHAQMRDLVRQFRDERGRLRSFREFRGVARTINEQYNQQWLREKYFQLLALQDIKRLLQEGKKAQRRHFG